MLKEPPLILPQVPPPLREFPKRLYHIFQNLVPATAGLQEVMIAKYPVWGAGKCLYISRQPNNSVFSF